MDEFRRLRADFEREASRYPDLRWAVVVLDEREVVRSVDGQTLKLQFLARGDGPEFQIMLWQHYYPVQAGGAIRLRREAWAVLHGADRDLFRRMASRAATAIPAAASSRLQAEIRQNVTRSDDARSGKKLTSFNSNPVATWFSWMLTTLTSFKPERLGGLRMPTDPFAASLPVFDYVLLAPPTADAKPARPEEQSHQPKPEGEPSGNDWINGAEAAEPGVVAANIGRNAGPVGDVSTATPGASVPEAGDTPAGIATPNLSDALAMALSQHRQAAERLAEAGEKATDKRCFAWLVERNERAKDEWNAWSRALRRAREILGEQKTSSRRARKGRSTVRQADN